LFVLLCSLAAYGACAAQKPCTISPIEIEEIRSDIRDLERELAERKELLAKLEAEIVERQGLIDERRERLSSVQAELIRLKKASGVVERTSEEKALSQPTSDTGF
jgi:septal ring factor EnvC (AmiA/AmiB activator)